MVDKIIITIIQKQGTNANEKCTNQQEKTKDSIASITEERQ